MPLPTDENQLPLALARSAAVASAAAAAHAPVCSPPSILPGLAIGCDVKRITGDTMVRLLNGEFRRGEDGQPGIDQFIVIDCRYDYEFNGGHITGAINLNDRALLSHFFHSHAHGSHLAIIFHCEFSQNRAPKSYRFFRSMDRTRNAAAYPALSFPEIAVLDGGYRAFFENHPTYCSPQAYVSMWDDAFQRECKEQTSKHRKSWGTGKALLAERDDGMQLPAARGLRRRSNTQVGGGEFSLARAASALEPVSGNSFFQAHSPARAASYTAGSSQAAAAAAAPSCMVGLSPAATRTSDEGASAAASATHSPLPSFSLASAANSPADVSFGAAAAAASSSLLPPLFTTPLPAARPLYAYQISPLAQLAFEGEDPEDAPIRMDTEREGIARTLAAH